ncbi:hypothetical protein LEP1GSC058_1662 [Leptospira fainei serovar Hurstbridge str. BUT 6]|uniref:PilZ domain-containing protein n=1 Tax=Leptospira fainei serovar Hurstbridge str. BUT 6 TaxID=1193011 RepID=S3V067_9LEPT|nr:PilZ domain-containing protein [Leptospira fainei]EPG74873.1 hypothetical protein LEP1GSC058_1662 [Leptospira fainei serovar Hurstbridge str. BUT 6]
MRERRQSERIYSEELCKFKVIIRSSTSVFNGFIMNISDIGVAVVSTIQSEDNIIVGEVISGQIQFPDSWDKLKFDGVIARKDYVSNDDCDSLILGIKFSNRITLPPNILKLALFVGGR